MRTSGFSMSSLNVRSSRISSSQNLGTRVPNGNLWSQKPQNPKRISRRSMSTTPPKIQSTIPNEAGKADTNSQSQNEAAQEKKRAEILSKTNIDKLVGKSGKYSKDLFVQAVMGDLLGPVNKDIQFLRKALEEDSSLRLALKVPKPEEQLLETIAKEGKFNKVTEEFLYFLREDKQFKSVNSILEGFTSLYNDYNNITSAEITVSSRASKERIMQILSTLKADLSEYPNLQLNVKKSDDISLGYKLQLGEYEYDQTREGMIEQRNAQLEPLLESSESTPDTWPADVPKDSFNRMKIAYAVAAQEPRSEKEANAAWEAIKKEKAGLKTALQTGKLAEYDSAYKSPAAKGTKVELKNTSVDRSLVKKVPTNLSEKFHLNPKESAAFATRALDHLVALNLFKNMEPVPKIMERYREYLKAGSNKAAIPPPSLKILKPDAAGKIQEIELIKKGTDVESFYKGMPKYVGRRVFFNPELDQYLYECKIAHWKLQASELTKDDPERSSYEQAIKLFEGAIYKVNYEPPAVENNPNAFVNLIKKTPEELAKVPVEVFKKLPANQLSQFDAKAIFAAINKEISFEPVDVEAVKKLPIETLKPVDLDVICMDINDDLRMNLRSKQLAIERAANDKKVKVDPMEAYTLTAAQLKTKFNLDINSAYDTRISELAQVKKDTEGKIRARGITPLPDRLEWFKY